VGTRTTLTTTPASSLARLPLHSNEGDPLFALTAHNFPPRTAARAWRPSEGYRALHWAGARGHVAVLQLLLTHGAEIEATTKG
jgi:hypothetical protein